VRFERVKHSLIGLAILLVVIWVVARVVLAVTSVALHLLWVVAIIAAIIWVIGRVRGSS
jgi:thiol:disulfide interchange protein